MRLCDACGKPIRGGYGIGGALVCRDCDPQLTEEIRRQRDAGQPVNARHIARQIYRETHDAGNYLFREIPDELWRKAKHRAADDDDSLRDLLLKALHTYLK